MAEIVIKIDAGAGYEDGDVLCAFNRRRIRCTHAQHICHVRQAPRNGSGLILPTALSMDWFEATHQHRFERVSASEIKRVEIATGTEDVFSDKPHKVTGEAIDVRLFIRRRKLQPQHYLFGEDGAEFWYGGQLDVSHAKLDRVWLAIESKSELREADHGRWPAGVQSLKSHLYVTVDDFDDATSDVLESPEVTTDRDGNETVVRKRQHRVDWSAALSLTDSEKTRARDRTVTLDLRDRQFTRTNIVRQKERAR